MICHVCGSQLSDESSKLRRHCQVRHIRRLVRPQNETISKTYVQTDQRIGFHPECNSKLNL